MTHEEIDAQPEGAVVWWARFNPGIEHVATVVQCTVKVVPNREYKGAFYDDHRSKIVEEQVSDVTHVFTDRCHAVTNLVERLTERIKFLEEVREGLK